MFEPSLFLVESIDTVAQVPLLVPEAILGLPAQTATERVYAKRGYSTFDGRGVDSRVVGSGWVLANLIRGTLVVNAVFGVSCSPRRYLSSQL